jgi:hypothetical protein
MHAPRPAENLVLREEARERRDAGNREARDRERDLRDSHVLAQTAHRHDVAGCLAAAVLHAVHDRASAEEEARLEERVSCEVEDRGDPVARSGRDEHEAELTHGGVREYFL